MPSIFSVDEEKNGRRDRGEEHAEEEPAPRASAGVLRPQGAHRTEQNKREGGHTSYGVARVLNPIL